MDTAVAPPVDLPTAESLVRGKVTVHRGRLFGNFEVIVQAEGKACVQLDAGIMWCDKEHLGSVYFEQRGAEQKSSNSYLRTKHYTKGNDTPTPSARDALIEGAREALQKWLAAHPLAWEAADLLAAKRGAESAAAEVVKLRKELAAAEREAATLTAVHEARVAALLQKGVLP